jgi:hypothetical protein
MPKLLYHEAETEAERMTATTVKLVIRDKQAERDRDLGELARRWAVSDSPHYFLARVLRFLEAQQDAMCRKPK